MMNEVIRDENIQAEIGAEKLNWPPTVRTTSRHTSKLRHLN